VVRTVIQVRHSSASEKARAPLAVFIGRFQPFHRGHERVVREGLALAHRVLVLVGSSNRQRSTRDPWTFDERKKLLLSAFSKEEQAHIAVRPLPDAPYHENGWLASVQNAAAAELAQAGALSSAQVLLLGCVKDASSYYLKSFPQWTFITSDGPPMDATDVRKALFAGDVERTEKMVPPAVYTQLKAFAESTLCQELAAEAEYIENYKKRWEPAPYAPTFVTVDAVVVQSGHVLLVRRAALPGIGQWALPGGFLRPKERILDGCVRRLYEETKLDVPETLLRASQARSAVFDDPYRSTRGRTITHAFCFQLPASADLPSVKGGDGASQVRWVPYAEATPERLFEDHGFVIASLL
jgi:bifunctional NMN adenylyltransferase/nudix hydrolase